MPTRFAGPFRDERPPFFARLMCDLAGRGQSFQFGERERSWTSDQAIHLQTPICEAVCQQTLIAIVFGRIAIHRRDLGNPASIEFARQ
jgi:hypothetical protein